MAKKTYWFLGSLVVLCVFLAAYFGSENLFNSGVFSLGAVGAIATFLYGVISEETGRRHEQEMQEKQNLFTLGAMSHMASTAFDKHAEFGTKYITEVDQGIDLLFEKGPCKDAVKIYLKLIEHRRSYVLWLNRDVIEKLRPFEMILREIGTKEHLLDHIGVGEKRTKVVEEVSDAFAKILNIPREDKRGGTTEEQEKVTRDSIVEELQRILGIEELLNLRVGLLKKAGSLLK